ncbi:MAG: long-chain fatty acid--CoA ligase [bacterium]|nr:long-chain fatty acid--CoA ligase [bacterium]
MIHADVLGERARLTPEKTALVDVASGQRLSYRELDERTVRCARGWLDRCGLRRGERAGILAHNRVEYVEAFFAAGKSGGVLVPLGTRLTAHELEPIVRDSGIRALLYDGAFAETVRTLRERVDVETWVALDEPVADGDPLYADWQRELSAAGWQRVPCGGEDLYCLLYTSGTTGKPKGVMIPHRMVAWNGYNTVCGWQLRADDVSPIFTPLYHAGGLTVFLVPIFVIGGTIVLHRGFDVEEIWRAIERERATVMLGVPTIYQALLEAPAFHEVDLGHVRWFISGGAPLPQYLVEAYQRRGVALKQGFGMTEVGVNCFAMTVDDSHRKAGSIGNPMMFTEVRLVDAEGREVPTGEVGEMLFRGPHVSLGYWRKPEATAAALDADGWFHSGDLARRDEDGFFYIAGRRKDMIISGGVNVYPAEIEAALVQHPAVAEAAVVGVSDRKWGEVGIAFVEPLAGATLTAEELVEHLAARLARFKLPKEFRLLDELPRTAYGKVIKGELRDRCLGEES